MKVENLFEDIKDGVYLLSLLEALSGEKLVCIFVSNWPLNNKIELHVQQQMNKLLVIMYTQKGIYHSACMSSEGANFKLCWTMIYCFSSMLNQISHLVCLLPYRAFHVCKNFFFQYRQRRRGSLKYIEEWSFI